MVRERTIDFDKLAHGIVGDTGWLEIQERADTAAPDWRPSEGKIPSSLEKVNCFLLRPSTDWVRCNHIMEVIDITESLVIEVLTSSKMFLLRDS